MEAPIEFSARLQGRKFTLAPPAKVPTAVMGGTIVGPAIFLAGLTKVAIAGRVVCKKSYIKNKLIFKVITFKEKT